MAEPDEVVIVTEQSSGQEMLGGDANVIGRYLGEINERVQRFKINPRSLSTGVVTMKFTIGIDGSLLSKQIATSSGVQVLDQAAMFTLDRAAPFPPIPELMRRSALTLTQQFRFVIR